MRHWVKALCNRLDFVEALPRLKKIKYKTSQLKDLIENCGTFWPFLFLFFADFEKQQSYD